MKSYIVRMECLTNLHVGNGDVNFGIIDRQVERDPVTGFPTINSSGVKGALRAFLVEQEKRGQVDQGLVGRAFGSSTGDGTTPGQVRVLAADLLARPARASKGARAFYLVTCDTLTDRYRSLLAEFAPEIADEELTAGSPDEDPSSLSVEGLSLEGSTPLGLQGCSQTVFKMSDDDFGGLDLPVNVRNHLDNGISTNLWYEEVVPHGSLFAFPIVATDTNADVLDELYLALDGQVVQFGAGASIGYGLCKLTVRG